MSSEEAAPVQKHPSLARLVHPRSIDDFLAAYRSSRPMVIHRGDPGYFADLLPLDELYRIVDNLREGWDVSLRPTQPASLAGSDGYICGEKVIDGYRRGLTVRLNHVDRLDAKVGGLRRGLMDELASLGYRMTDEGRAVVFLTPHHSKQGGPHMDPQDLFIVQLEGKKTWHFHGDTPVMSREYGWPPGRVPETMTAEVCAGDTIFVPRGFIHHAETTDSHSYAITIAVRPMNLCDIAGPALLEAMWRTPALLESLGPEDFDGAGLSAIGKQKLYERIGDLATSAALEAEVEAYQHWALPPALDGFAAVNDLNTLTVDARLVPVATMRCMVEDGQVKLKAGPRRLAGPLELREVFEWVAGKTEGFQIGALPGTEPEVAVEFARQLICAGLFRIG